MITEQKRLEKLLGYKILDTQAESDFDELVLLASRICETPISLISLIDENRQWFKANVGLDASETPRNISFCHHAIQHNGIFVVEDAAEDERFRNNPLVTGYPDIRFYAGMPLSTSDGYNLGTLCVIDRVPRNISEHQRETLRILSKQVIKQFDLRASLEKERNYGNLLEEKRQQLEELNTLKNKIFSIVAHDLRTPLRNIANILEMFDDKSIDQQEMQELMPKLGEKVASASEMLNNLLNWSQNQFTKRLNPVLKENITLILEEKVERMRPFVSEKGIRLDARIPPDLHAYVEPEVLRMVMRNLITNAIKFTQKGGSIFITTAESPAEITVSVRDTGAGISEENLQKIFDDAGHHSTYGTSNEKGIGIGLKLCKSIINKNNGDLSVVSKPGLGSTFTIHMKTLA